MVRLISGDAMTAKTLLPVFVDDFYQHLAGLPICTFSLASGRMMRESAG